VELGRLARWSPLPLSIRDARREVADLRTRIGRGPVAEPRDEQREPVAVVRNLVARYGDTTALTRVNVDIRRGDIVALMGRNGAGKSTLLAHLAGLRAPAHGTVTVRGDAPHQLKPRDLVARVALVPSDPSALLYAASVGEECAVADREAALAPGTTAAAVGRVLDAVDPQRHPRDLSEGQRLALALGIVLGPAPDLVLLDEPTRGLDYAAKERLAATLRDLAGNGRAIVVATHDVELVADVATRVIFLADGEVVGDSSARDAIAASTMFAPQVARILQPSTWLTVSEVREALLA
jgi:energy-coupling factor transport system ATP-binding protein